MIISETNHLSLFPTGCFHNIHENAVDKDLKIRQFGKTCKAFRAGKNVITMKVIAVNGSPRKNGIPVGYLITTK